MMKLMFNCDTDGAPEQLYIDIDGSEKAISVNESVDILADRNITIYTKKKSKLKPLSMIALFLKRLVLNLFNIIIMNVPGKWYENLEPFVLSPLSIRVERDTMIKYVPTKIDCPSEKVEKRQLFVDNQIVHSETEFDEESVNVAFITYSFDVISLLLYACVPVSLVFIYSGAIDVPIVMFLYISIMLVIIVPLALKIANVNKEKKMLIKVLRNI